MFETSVRRRGILSSNVNTGIAAIDHALFVLGLNTPQCVKPTEQTSNPSFYVDAESRMLVCCDWNA